MEHYWKTLKFDCVNLGKNIYLDATCIHLFYNNFIVVIYGSIMYVAYTYVEKKDIIYNRR